MSELAKEVADELKQNSQGLTWFQRVGLIVFANVVSLLLVSVLIAAGGMLWSKAMSTDDIKKDVAEGDARLERKLDTALDKARAERDTILSTVAEMSAENRKVVEMVNRLNGGDQTEWLGPLVAPAAQIVVEEVTEPSASAVREERAQMQRKIDEAIYREDKH